MKAAVAAGALVALVALVACHRESSADAPGDPNVPGSLAECTTAPCPGDAAPLPPPPDQAGRNEDWKRATAAEADADDLARLAQREGAGGLEAKLGSKGSTDAPTRHAAISALAFVAEPERFDALPYLAKLAASDDGDKEDVARALETIESLAARPHRAVDREDAESLAQGCGLLAALATSRDTARAAAARRALGMLGDYGCHPPGAGTAAGDAG